MCHTGHNKIERTNARSVNKELKKIFNLKKNNEGEYKIQELKDHYDEVNIVGTLKSMIISRAELVLADPEDCDDKNGQKEYGKT